MFSASMTLVGPAFTGIHADTLYTLRIVDAMGCIVEMAGPEGLTVPRGGFASLNVDGDLSMYPGGYNISSFGGSDGYVQLNIYGQMSQPTILWTDGVADEYREMLSAGYYEVTVTDDAGQSVTRSWTLIEPSNELSAFIENTAGGCGEEAYLQSYVNGGVPPYNYQWVDPSAMHIGDGWSYLNVYNDQQEGQYQLIVWDANGGDTTYAYYSVAFTGLVANFTSPEVAPGVHVGCSGEDGVVNIEVSGGEGPYTVSVDDYQGGYYEFTTGDTLIVVDSLKANYYWIKVSDMNNCVSETGITLNGTEPIKAEVAFQTYPNGEIFSCDTCHDAILDLSITGGMSPYTVNWSTGQTGTTHTGTQADAMLSFLVTDQMGCTYTDSAMMTRTMNNGMQLLAEVSQYPGGYNVSSATADDGYIDLTIVGGTSPYNVNWYRYNPEMMTEEEMYEFGGQYNANNLKAGQYRVAVSDMNAEYEEKIIYLIGPKDSLMVNLEGEYNNCQGYGQLNAYVNGGTPPYNYQWSGPYGPTGEGWSYLDIYEAEEYTVIVIDMNGDSTLVSRYFDGGPSLSFSMHSPAIYGDANAGCSVNDGSIIIEINGGTPPFNINLNGSNKKEEYSSGNSEPVYFYLTTSDTVIVIDSLGAGYYNIDISDMSGCGSDGQSIELTSPPSLKVDAVPLTLGNGYYFSCDTCPDGSVTAGALNGVPPINYSWVELPADRLSFKVEGASMYFDEMKMVADLENGEPPAPISSDATLNGLAPRTWYGVMATDQLGCSGGKAFTLDGPKEEMEPDPAWKLGGNTGENNWLGTNDSTDLVMKSNNQAQLRLGAEGVTEVLGQLKLSDIPTLDAADAVGTKVLLLTPEGGVAMGGEGFFPLLPEENTPMTVCEADPGGEYIEYWTYEPNKIYVECPQIDVGIGTSTPAARLDVRGQTYTKTLSINTYDQEAKVTIKGGSPGSQNQFKALEVQDTDGNGVFRVFNDGKVVVGSALQQEDDEATLFFGDGNHYVRSVYGGGLRLGTLGSIDALVIEEGTGKVSIQNKVMIGSETIVSGPHADSKLSVDGKIVARELFIHNEQSIWGWPDYVFDDKYKLRSIEELGKFIEKNNHLPGMVDAKTVQEQGIEFSTTAISLLEKVEELSLYVILLNDKIKKLEKKLEGEP